MPSTAPAPGRRLRRVLVPPELLAGLCQVGPDVSVAFGSDVPLDAQMVYSEPSAAGYVLVFEHDSFPVVPRGQEAAIHPIRFEVRPVPPAPPPAGPPADRKFTGRPWGRPFGN